MSPNRPNLALQIALIIFVLITITLAVTTVIYFNENKDNIALKETAEKAKAAADAAKLDADVALQKVLEIVGRGSLPAATAIPDSQKSKVEPVIDEFTKDKAHYAATFPEPAQPYPQMLKNVIDAYVAVQTQLADKDKEIAKLQQEKVDQAKTIGTVKAEYDTSIASVSKQQRDDRDQFTSDRGTFEKEKADLAKQLETKNATVKLDLDKKDDDIKKRDQVIDDLKNKGDKVKGELEKFKKVDFKAPDGTIVKVNQRLRTVWIDRGRADGIKPQMIFSVYDRSAENIAGDVKEKGALEVIRILDAHHSEAAITKDDLKNPLMPEDKIMNPAYLAGQPQHFAIAGFIDFDGDGQSDLNRLLTLIHNNGGEVDVMVDENGKLTGAITPSTSLLVIGIHPDEKKLGEAASKSWNRILKDADDMKIGSMNVPEFLKYMGYQGRERSVPLGKDAADSPDAPFSKRPPRGADGGAF